MNNVQKALQNMKIKDANDLLSTAAERLRLRFNDIDDLLIARSMDGRGLAIEFIKENKSYELLDEEGLVSNDYLGASSSSNSRLPTANSIASIIGPQKGLLSREWIEKRASMISRVELIVDGLAHTLKDRLRIVRENDVDVSSVTLPKEILDLVSGRMNDNREIALSNMKETALLVSRFLGSLTTLIEDKDKDDLPNKEITSQMIDEMLRGWTSNEKTKEEAEAKIFSPRALEHMKQQIDNLLSGADDRIKSQEVRLEEAKNMPDSQYALPDYVIKMCTGSNPIDEKKLLIENLTRDLENSRATRNLAEAKVTKRIYEYVDAAAFGELIKRVDRNDFDECVISDEVVFEACSKAVSACEKDAKFIAMLDGIGSQRDDGRAGNLMVELLKDTERRQKERAEAIKAYEMTFK